MIQTNKKQSGFTIVELLIVIVVIGILAAITIVAYNGVQNRANNTKIDTIAKEIADKSEVYAADHEGTYPTASTDFSGTSALSANASGAIATTAAAGKVVVTFCNSGAGVSVTPWDYTKKSAQTNADKDKTPRIRTVGTCTTPAP